MPTNQSNRSNLVTPFVNSQRGHEARERAKDPLAELVEPAPLADRVAPALLQLALQRTISWGDARFVLDAVERQIEALGDWVGCVAAQRVRWYRLLGGTELSLADFRAKTRHQLETGKWL